MASKSEPRDFLLDVSRLIWRLRSARLPTGIDRVCLEYVANFGTRSQAVVQFKGRIFVLSPRASDRLFALILRGGEGLRPRLMALALRSLSGVARAPARPGMTYLNVGHTGLHERALPAWIHANAVRAIYLIHDLIPITHPQFCREGEARKHIARIENALKSAAGIIGNSQATLDEVAAFASERGLPMPPSIAAWIRGYRPGEMVEPTRLERPHFITVGTIEGRKNHILLLRIWHRFAAEMGKEAPILVIVGQRGWKSEAVTSSLDDAEVFGGSVLELGRCGDIELRGLLAGARALLMPSFAEGFGLPIIEALEAGTPVIASDLAVYREVVGGIPTYLDPLDEGAWEAAIRAFLGSSSERVRQLQAIPGFAPPEWPRHFETVERWLGWPASPKKVSAPVQQFVSRYRG
jgi:glycosyltransferase involved in cell wall biosynthesis